MSYVHCEEYELPDGSFVLVNYRFTPAITPAPRTMSNPMGTDDGAPSEVDILSIRDSEGQPVDLNEYEMEAIELWLLDLHEGS